MANKREKLIISFVYEGIVVKTVLLKFRQLGVATRESSRLILMYLKKIYNLDTDLKVF